MIDAANRMTAKEFRAQAAKPVRKYRNKPIEQDGKTFASKLQHKHHYELLLRQKLGFVRDVQHEPRFDLKVDGKHVCQFTPDHSFLELIKGKWIWKVADSKGEITKKRDDAFKVRARLFTAIYGPEVEIWDK